MRNDTVSRLLPGRVPVRGFFRPGLFSAALALTLGFGYAGHLSAAYSFSEIWAFYSGPPGACPNGKALLVAPDKIFGTTYYGGTTDNGVVFELTTPDNGKTFSETVLYSFTGGADGGNPAAGLKIDANGALYGTTTNSNGQPIGVVFQLSPPAQGQTSWKYKAIHAFAGAPNDGANPNSDLFFGKNGSLWGTTVNGGSNNQGTVFQLVPGANNTWTENLIYSFTGTTDGAQPYAGISSDASGNLYGETYTAGSGNSGTVFQLLPPAKGKPTWTENTIYSFTGGADGLNPLGGITVTPSGALLGTTYLGGSFNDGVIFLLTPKNGGGFTQSVVVDFNGTNGANPSDTIVPDLKGNYFGTTGGAQAGLAGNVFKLVPTGNNTNPFALKVLYTFTGGADGQAALPSVSQSTQGAVYGTTFYGGQGGAGSVFRIN